MVNRIAIDDVAVPMPDGVKLASDVVVPDDGERHPVLLIRSPYGRMRSRAMLDPVGLARLGWAVVAQDVRGRWDSEGEFLPFAAERADGAAAVEWCRTQPWSNGNVAMAGASYVGMTQWLAAAERPKGLRAIAPMVTVADVAGEALFPSEVLAHGTFTGWALSIGAIGSRLAPDVVARARQELDAWPPRPGAAMSDSVIGELTPAGLDWLDRSNDALMGPLDVSEHAADSDLAAYHVAGWHDIFCEGNLRAYAALTAPDRPDSVRRKQRLIVGPWSHGTVLQRVTGDLDFGVAADGQFNGVPEEQVGFLTRAVAGQEVPSGVRVFVMGSNRWLDLPGWPAETTPRTFYLAAGGRLADRPDEAAGADRYRHDPADPVPTVGGRTLHPVPPRSGPLDQSEVERRSDVLVYTGEELTEGVTVLGAVRADLAFESSAERADVAVKLVDVHPDGRAMLVVDGVRRVELTPGQPAEVTVEVGSTGITFGAGHRIRVEIASSSFPKYDVCEGAEQAVHVGGRAASRITLPVYELV